jgi:hypothetical protein
MAKLSKGQIFQKFMKNHRSLLIKNLIIMTSLSQKNIFNLKKKIVLRKDLPLQKKILLIFN